MIDTRLIDTRLLENISGGIARTIAGTPRSRFAFNTLASIEGHSGLRYNLMQFIQQAKRSGSDAGNIKSDARLNHRFDSVNPEPMDSFIDKWFD